MHELMEEENQVFLIFFILNGGTEEGCTNGELASPANSGKINRQNPLNFRKKK